MFFFLLFHFVLIVSAQELCGKGCSYSIDEQNSKLSIEVDGIIELESYLNQMASIKTIEIKGEIKSYPQDLINKFISLESVIINTKSIPTGFFANSKMKEVTIGTNVELIEERSFESCYDLISIEFETESKVKEIGDYCFKNCINLKEIQLLK